MLTTRPRGTNDVIPGEVEKWRYVEDSFRQLCREYGYAEIRTPLFEHTELFNRSVGDTTDIVEKEMYTFFDRSNRSITLRPEGTAPVARAYLENGLHKGPQPVKLYYAGPMFRYDRPQAGRYRQFHQLAVEVFGSPGPAIDAEVMAMVMDFTGRLQLDVELRLNSVGCPECRPVLRQKLKSYFEAQKGNLCKDCLRRLEQNPLRALDCKEPDCRELAAEAPTSLDCLCPECAGHFEEVQRYLAALDIPYAIDRHLVRGLDYYTKTAFEIVTPQSGAKAAAGGGGRYDGLVASLGGPSVPGIGYALGLERLLGAMEEQGAFLPGKEALDVFLASGDGIPEEEALKLLWSLRKEGVSADKDYLGRSLKAQMKFAGKAGARFVAILGPDELARGTVALKNMATGSQIEVPATNLAGEVRRLLFREEKQEKH